MSFAAIGLFPQHGGTEDAMTAHHENRDSSDRTSFSVAPCSHGQLWLQPRKPRSLVAPEKPQPPNDRKALMSAPACQNY
ncbi:hypothetical protein, partial [Xanthomonas fragariae]